MGLGRPRQEHPPEYSVNAHATEDAPLLPVTGADESAPEGSGEKHGTAFTAFFTMCTGKRGAAMQALRVLP